MAYNGNMVAWGNLAPSLQEIIDNGSGSSFFKPYELTTTSLNQKIWDLPLGIYDSVKDSIIVYHNGSLLDSNEWFITGDAGSGYKINIPENPIANIEDNNVTALIIRNADSNIPQEFSGTLLTDKSVGINKLGQDVQDAIANAGQKLEIVNDLVTGGATKVASAETVKTLKTQVDGMSTEIEKLKTGGDSVVIDGVKYTPKYMMMPKSVDLPISELYCAGKDYYYTRVAVYDGGVNKYVVYRVNKNNGKKELISPSFPTSNVMTMYGNTMFISSSTEYLDGKYIDLKNDTIRVSTVSMWSGLNPLASEVLLLDDVFFTRSSSANGLISLMKVDSVTGQKIKSASIDVKPIFKLYFPTSGTGARIFPVREACHITSTHLFLIMRDAVDGNNTFNIMLKIDRNTLEVTGSVGITMNASTVSTFIDADFNIGSDGNLYSYLYHTLSGSNLSGVFYSSINCETMSLIKNNVYAEGGKIITTSRTVRNRIGKNHIVSYTTQTASGGLTNATMHYNINRFDSDNGEISLVEVFANTETDENIFSLHSTNEFPSFADDLEFIYMSKLGAINPLKMLINTPNIISYNKEMI